MPQPTNGAGSAQQNAALTPFGQCMTHQLMLSAKKKWRKLDGQNRLLKIIEGFEFQGGIKHDINTA